jgi:hypothetical protein
MQAAHTLFDWWHQMAAMQYKYGRPSDIERKPEWPELQRLQKLMLRQMHEHTGVHEDVLLDTVQHAIIKVMGSGPASLDRHDAEAVVAEALRMAVHHEAVALQAAGVRN